MRFHDKSAHLILNCPDGSDSSDIRIVADAAVVFPQWNASTRMSPIYPTVRGELISPTDFDFPGEWFLTFLGPAHPERVPSLGRKDNHAWLSLGLFNILIATQDRSAEEEALEWAESQHIPFESWLISDGTVVRTKNWTRPD